MVMAARLSASQRETAVPRRLALARERTFSLVVGEGVSGRIDRSRQTGLHTAKLREAADSSAVRAKRGRRQGVGETRPDAEAGPVVRRSLAWANQSSGAGDRDDRGVAEAVASRVRRGHAEAIVGFAWPGLPLYLGLLVIFVAAWKIELE